MRFRESLASIPGPEVVPKAKRRKFSAAYKRRILEDAEQHHRDGKSRGPCHIVAIWPAHVGRWRLIFS
jgi:uncharacterized cupin superfamily protein